MAAIDFSESACRNWKDAVYLDADGREANAAQHYGFSAECAVKTLLISFGLKTKADGDISMTNRRHEDQKRYRTHIDGLASVCLTYASSSDFSRYAAMMPTLASFRSWSVDQRYYSDSVLQSILEADYNKWKTAAGEAMHVHSQLRLDGRIR
jgi:hypothetical protein